MSEGSRPNAWDDFLDESAERLASSIEARQGLFDAIWELRQLGPNGMEAVDAVLSTRTVDVLKCSWELFDELAWNAGADGLILVADHVGAEVIAKFQLAVYGLDPLDEAEGAAEDTWPW